MKSIFAMLLCILFASIVHADELVVYHAYYIEKFECSELYVDGTPDTGMVSGACNKVIHEQDGDGLFKDGFEDGDGGWGYNLAMLTPHRRFGCWLLSVDTHNVAMSCNEDWE